MAPRIALIHATPLAMGPIAAAFDRAWPDAQRMNILDDRLSGDLAARGTLDAAMHRRIAALARYAVEQGAAAILFTCSAFGPAIDAAAADVGVPTLKPNGAMFRAAIGLGAEGAARAPRIGLVTTFAPAAASLAEEFMAMADGAAGATVESVLAGGAMEALAAGDEAAHDARIVAAARTVAHCDAIMLGQFSMARAQGAVAAAVAKPILSSPDSAVRALQRLLQDHR